MAYIHSVSATAREDLKMKTGWMVIALLLIASALAWQHQREKAVADAKAKEQLAASLQLAPQILPHPDKELEIFDTEMVLTNAIPTRADQRPVYKVSGRIRNHMMYPVDEVWLKIDLYDAISGTNADSALVKLENLGLEGNDSVVSFSRTIQILPPKTTWGWRYDIVQAKTDPEFADTNFDFGIESSK
jgi:hypothetical protein